jgi:hypothetical protein
MGDSSAGMALVVIMAAPTPAGFTAKGPCLTSLSWPQRPATGSWFAGGACQGRCSAASPGCRHQLPVILGLALCAVVAGARSFTAIAEWAADADDQTLRVLGISGVVPSELPTRSGDVRDGTDNDQAANR